MIQTTEKRPYGFGNRNLLETLRVETGDDGSGNSRTVAADLAGNIPIFYAINKQGDDPLRFAGETDAETRNIQPARLGNIRPQQDSRRNTPRGIAKHFTTVWAETGDDVFGDTELPAERSGDTGFAAE